MATPLPSSTRVLPDLPSGRPRRLLLFTDGLQPDDPTLHAFDIARHLHAHGRWFARVISAAEGPLRADFEASAVSVQVIDRPGAWDAFGQADLEKQIWWPHQHAAAVFGSARAWAEPLARRHGLPVLTGPAGALPGLWFDLHADIARRKELRARLGLGDDARLALTLVKHASAEASALDTLRAVQAELKQSNLTAWHLGSVAPAGTVTLLAPDGRATVHTVPAGSVALSAWVGAADAVVRLRHDEAHLRPALDAAALAVPILSASAPTLAALVPAPFVAAIDPESPSSVAHALIDLTVNPEAAARRVAAAHVYVMRHASPTRLLPAWITALETAVATCSGGQPWQPGRLRSARLLNENACGIFDHDRARRAGGLILLFITYDIGH